MLIIFSSGIDSIARLSRTRGSETPQQMKPLLVELKERRSWSDVLIADCTCS